MIKKIGIDLHVVDGIYQGSRSHVLEIFSRVVRLCPDIQFYLFLEGIHALKKSPSFELSNVDIVQMMHANPLIRLGRQLPRFQKKLGLDLLHTQYISPVPSYSKTIITLHDILFENYGKYFSPVFNLRSKILMRLSASRAQHIFTVSEYSRKEIITIYGVNPEKVTVIYNGVDRNRFYPGKDGIQIIKSAGLETNNYILTVGRLEPRKNHISLINAYSKLQTVMPLVIVGNCHFGFQNIKALVKNLGISDRVLFFENVSEMELPSFYRHARLFVYPTWAEGFGMPVIEAMSSGIPVITSNTTSLPEVVSDAGILIDPSSIFELHSAMSNMLRNQELISIYKKRGVSRARKFNWDESARRVVNIYRKILDG